MTSFRIFIDVDGKQVAAIDDALAVPHIGDQVWIKTVSWQGTVKVESVEHQFDRSRPDQYGTQDVELICKMVER